MAGSLPDYLDTRGLRDELHLRVASGCLPQLIRVHEHRAVHIGGLTLALTLGNAPSSKVNERQWVPAARPQQIYVQVHIATPILEQSTYPSPIAALTFAFAA